MHISVRIIPRAKKNSIKQEINSLKVHLTAPPQDGKANQLLVELLADYFKVKKSQVIIVKGEKSQNKIITIR